MALRWSIAPLICLMYATGAVTTTTQLEASSMSPMELMDSHAMDDRLFQSNMQLFHDSRKHLPPKIVLSPSPSPPYSDTPSDRSPASSQLSKPSTKRNGLTAPNIGLTPPNLVDISPTNSGGSSDPSILAQPPLSSNITSKFGNIKHYFCLFMFLSPKISDCKNISISLDDSFHLFN